MGRVGFAVFAFVMLAIGVATTYSPPTIEPADADPEPPLSRPPDPVAIHEGEAITWRGVVFDAWQGGCRLRQMVTGPDGKTRAIAPAILFANEKDWEKAMHAGGKELAVRGIVKGGTIMVAEWIRNELGHSSSTSKPEPPPPCVPSRRHRGQDIRALLQPVITTSPSR